MMLFDLYVNERCAVKIALAYWFIVLGKIPHIAHNNHVAGVHRTRLHSSTVDTDAIFVLMRITNVKTTQKKRNAI